MINLRDNLAHIILVAIILVLGFALIYSYLLEPQEIKIYFSGPEGQYLMPETRSIRAHNSAEIAISELIAGPTSEELAVTIPEGTELLSLDVEDGLATVDFSQEIVDNHWGGSTGEMMTVFSIVNTLTQLQEIDEVQILVEGEAQETLAGHLDLTKPLKFNSNLVN